jgi:hypothetical protein
MEVGADVGIDVGTCVAPWGNGVGKCVAPGSNGLGMNILIEEGEYVASG